MDLCQYKDVLGVPGKGVHSYRIFNIAIVDVLLTFIFAYLFYYCLWDNYDYGYWVYVVLLFVIGIVLHRVFCVKTTIDVMLFGE